MNWATKIGWRKIYAYVALEDFDVTFTDYGPGPKFEEEEISILQHLSSCFFPNLLARFY